MTRQTKIIVAAVSALAVVLVVCTIVVVNVVGKAQSQAAYERCLASFGFTPETVGTGDLDELAEAAEFCLDRP